MPVTDYSKSLWALGKEYGTVIEFTSPSYWDIIDIQEIDGSWTDAILEVAGLTAE